MDDIKVGDVLTVETTVLLDAFYRKYFDASSAPVGTQFVVQIVDPSDSSYGIQLLINGKPTPNEDGLNECSWIYTHHLNNYVKNTENTYNSSFTVTKNLRNMMRSHIRTGLTAEQVQQIYHELCELRW